MSGAPRSSYKVKIPDELHGERLDKAVTALCDGLSRTTARKLLAAGAVRLDGKRCRTASRPVSPGTTLEVAVGEGALAAETQPPTVVREGDGFLVVAKPPGQHVQGTAQGDAGTTMRSVELHLRRRRGRPHLIHRLDAEASGLVLLATSKDAAASLSMQLRERSVERAYLAIVHGLPEHLAGTIDLPLRKAGRGRMEVSADGVRAVSRYRLLSTYPTPGASLLRVELSTGRLHQIRVHLASTVGAIVGDSRYGGDPRGARLRLHAEALSFSPPGGGERVTVALPPDPSFWSPWDG